MSVIKRAEWKQKLSPRSPHPLLLQTICHNLNQIICNKSIASRYFLQRLINSGTFVSSLSQRILNQPPARVIVTLGHRLLIVQTGQTHGAFP